MDPLLQEIIPIRKVYDRYLKKTDEISLFIGTAEEQKDFVEIVEVKPETQKFILGLKELSNSVVLYNAAIISIYGSYELFLDELLKAYINYLKRRNESYEDFPEKLKKKHIAKSAEFLTNPQRFVNMGLNNKAIISALDGSYIKGQSAVLLDELLLSHSGNLSTKQLNSLLEEYGFINPIHKLLKHFSFRELYNNSRLSDDDVNNVFPFLNQIVEERNKVGHGWIVDTRLTFSSLRESYLPFMTCLCNAVKDLVVSQIIQDHIDSNCIESFDPIIDIWKDGKVIGINSKNFRLKVGEYLYYSTADSWNYSFLIENLQNDKKNRKEIRADNKDICIQSDMKIKQNYKIWGYVKTSET